MWARCLDGSYLNLERVGLLAVVQISGTPPYVIQADGGRFMDGRYSTAAEADAALQKLVLEAELRDK